MRIAILSFGSRGDVQPYLALGLGLKHAGHTVRVVTQRDCESLVREYGLEYGAVAGDVRAMMQSEVGQQAINTSPNPIRFGWDAMKLAQPLLRQMAIDCLTACEESDVLLCFAFFRPFGVSLAEKLHIPYAEVAVVPMHPTRAFPSPSLPLAKSIIAAVDDQEMRYRAAKVGEHIRAEDGVGQAVEAFQHYCQLAV